LAYSRNRCHGIAGLEPRVGGGADDIVREAL
jgi:hypothetical protein